MAKRASKVIEALGRVLVVEDDALLAAAIEDALLAAGADGIIVCTTTAEALAALRDQSPDAMVLDVHLADRNDGWALAELVEMLGTRPPRIVFSTGAPQDIPEAVAEMGAIFEKPYDPADLVAALSGEERRGLFAKLRDAMG
jgi:DNA-binding response OmpR family regulator